MLTRYEVDGERSTVLVAARSSMGAMVFQTQGLRGHVDAVVDQGIVSTEGGPTAEVEIDVRTLYSGNDLYDAELMRRIDARRFPTCHLRLVRASSLTVTRLSIEGEMEFHGVSRPAEGIVDVESASEERLVVTGAKELDIRDFDVPAPRVLMMKIYPEVQVQLFLEARSTIRGRSEA